MMIILDTNVVSALMQSTSDKEIVTNWLNTQPAQSIWTTSVSVFEIQFGLSIMPKGKRQSALQLAFELTLSEDFEGRVLDFNAAAAREAAVIAAELRLKGRPIEIRDVQIAGIVTALHGTLATRNTKHFVDTEIPLINPWDNDFE